MAFLDARGSRGNIRISSTSKIRKIRETRKNWMEKLCQLLSNGLNPHSKGLSFSVSRIDFRGRSAVNTATTTDSAMAREIIWKDTKIKEEQAMRRLRIPSRGREKGRGLFLLQERAGAEMPFALAANGRQ